MKWSAISVGNSDIALRSGIWQLDPGRHVLSISKPVTCRR
jgi:hypothetical protein